MTDATPEPGSPRMVVVLGAPRSGTTWLQHLLASHPLVATMPEPHLFALYVYPLLQTWDRQRAEVSAAVDSLSRGCAPPDRLVGLPACLTEAEVQRALAGLLQPIVDRVMSAAPATRAVVEKTPSNSLVVPYIERVVPGALYIHIIRDPRSVVTSLVDVARSWGRSWAPRSAAAAALMWRAHVVGATEARAFPDRYIELRYEDLR
ncbi:MAG TPA: sulfotransferase, partial [Acidimicrobiales bacterium]|nr:sulfotransferase [Acidimicrobiales bacterium]